MSPTTHYKTKYGTKICVVCKKEFWKKHRSPEQWKEAKCCSEDCYHKSRIGIKRPDAVAILAKNRLKHKGKKHWNWKGGISDENSKIRRSYKYNEWRQAVYKRDHWTCRICREKIKHPIAHHIKAFNDYPELRFEVKNGITLCRSCHRKVHKDIGLLTRFN